MPPRRRPVFTTDARADDAACERPSKTALKAKDRALQDLGVALAELPPGSRRKLPLDEPLRRAIDDYNAIRAHGAKKRQRKFLGKLLRLVDVEPLQQAVAAFRQGRRVDAAALHQIERWRAELVADDEALTRFLIAFPDTDVQRLRSWIRAARKAGDADQPSERHSRAWRELFKEIRALLEAAAQDRNEAPDEAR